MVKSTAYDLNSKQTSVIELNNNLFNQKSSIEMLQFVIKDFFHVGRAKTATAKTRAEVSGGGKKPWKQKGTGRARAGTNSSPLWVGGGVTFGPNNLKKVTKVNKKVKQKALKGALTQKSDSIFILINDSDFERQILKVKDFFAIKNTLNLTKDKILYVTKNIDSRAKVLENIAGLKISSVFSLNVFDILNSDFLFIEESAIKQLEEIYSK